MAEAKQAKSRSLLLAALIIVITAAVHLPALRGGFVWDDEDLITGSRLMHAPDGLRRIWFTAEPYDYFPLTYTSFWIEWRLWGTNPAGYHALNILLHALNAILVWWVLRTLKIPGAWLAGLIFGVHPVTVQSVAWISERKNTLSLLFMLLSLLAHLRAEKPGAEDQAREFRPYCPAVPMQAGWPRVVSIFLFLCALLSKTSVVMMPCILLLCAWRLRGRATKRDMLIALPYFILSLIFGLITIWFQHHRAMDEELVGKEGFLARAAGAGWAAWFYLYKALFPFRLSFLYERWQVDAGSPLAWAPLLLLSAVFGMLWRYRNGWARPLLFGLGFHALMLVPVLGFLDMSFRAYSLVSDHLQYAALIGPVALAIGLGARTLERLGARGWTVALLAAALVAVLGALTFSQAMAYRDEFTLWRDTLRKNPRCWVAHNNLARAAIRSGDAAGAIFHLEAVVRLRPDYAEGRNNLGMALAGAGRLEEGVAQLQEAVRLKPESKRLRANLERLLEERRRQQQP